MTTTALMLAAAALAWPSGLLVSPADLASRASDPAVVVLHIEDRDGDFANGHLPGARVVRYRQIAIDGPQQLGSELPSVAELREVFQAAGVGAASHVVVYGSPIAATRAFFTLDYLGHPNVRVLNGGLSAWRLAGHTVELGASQPPRRDAGTLASLTPRPGVVAHADWLVTQLESPRITLVDARPDAEFTGADGGMNGMHVKGHLPDARQLVWNALLDSSGKFLPDAELRKQYEAIGATKGTPLVSYCMIGMRASVTYFVARHLGYDARMYDGSIVDWTRRKLPAVMGSNRWPNSTCCRARSIC
jgi:thiosulfate/3-mercaptopyruvate sulfurtransferase